MKKTVFVTAFTVYVFCAYSAPQGSCFGDNGLRWEVGEMTRVSRTIYHFSKPSLSYIAEIQRMNNTAPYRTAYYVDVDGCDQKNQIVTLLENSRSAKTPAATKKSPKIMSTAAENASNNNLQTVEYVIHALSVFSPSNVIRPAKHQKSYSLSFVFSDGLHS